MKLNIFNGGLSKRLDPTLIGTNEAVCLLNVDNTQATLKSCCGMSEVSGVNISGYFYNYKDQWLSSTLERSYVEYKNTLYYTEKGQYPRKYDGQREYKLGIDKPVNPLTVVEVNPSGTEKISDVPVVLQYVYTYYNSTDGIESAPSPPSIELNLAANKVVDISNIEISTDVQVNKIRIYRIGAGATEFTLFKEIDNVSNAVRDDLPTINLLGRLLESETNYPAKFDSQHLVEAYGSLFAAVGSKLYFTPPGFPAYWPEEYFMDFVSDITGLLPVPNGILVFSKDKTDILLGTKASDFSVGKVSDEYGCVSHTSCKNCKGIPFWVSLSGICTYSTGVVSVISREKLDKLSLDIVNVISLEDQYFICKSNGKMLCMDLRFEPQFKEYKFSEAISNIQKYNDELYARVGSKLYKLFAGAAEQFRYVSPKLTEGDYSVTKLYNNIYMKSKGEFEVKILIDDEIVSERMYQGFKTHDMMPNMEDQRGESIQFDITGIGTIFEIEYKAMGRQNGR